MENRMWRSQRAFTLVELLVVIAIIGILATIGLVSFTTSQMRSRDAKRKSDLKQVANALELFYSDYESYPGDDGAGKMKACPYVSGDTGKTLACVWGESEFRDEDGSNNKKTAYFIQLPNDPRGVDYYYVSSGAGYKLFARLENPQDPSIKGGYTFGEKVFNFAVTSTNEVAIPDVVSTPGPTQ